MSEKLPYTPSEKRFEISKDKWSRERIRKLVELNKELNEKFPCTIAFSLSGSLSKGKEIKLEEEAEKADIDLYVFFDAEEAKNNYKYFFCNYSIFKDDFENLNKKMGLKIEEYVEYEFLDNVAFIIFSEIVNKLKGIQSQIYTEPISEKIISSDIRDKINTSSYGSYNKPEIQDVHKYFHLDIGGKLYKYQKFIVETLIKKCGKEEAEELWEKIYSNIINFERGFLKNEYLGGPFLIKNHKKYNLTLPSTLDEAIKYYKIKL